MLSYRSLDFEIPEVQFVFDEKPDVIINIVDATVLERSLYLTTQLLELDSKIIVALNMADILEEKGDEIFAGADSVVLEVDIDKVTVKKVFELAEKYGVKT